MPRKEEQIPRKQPTASEMGMPDRCRPEMRDLLRI